MQMLEVLAKIHEIKEGPPSKKVLMERGNEGGGAFPLGVEKVG